jgi:hypothetical protein
MCWDTREVLRFKGHHYEKKKPLPRQQRMDFLHLDLKSALYLVRLSNKIVMQLGRKYHSSWER